MTKLSINIAVLNGEKYIAQCLESVLNQHADFSQLELHILDNGSGDATVRIIQGVEPRLRALGLAAYHFKISNVNLGMWGAQEELLKNSHGEYAMFLSADVVLDKDFAARAIAAMDADVHIGGLQAKIYQYNIGEPLTHTTIDTCGFKLDRSRRILNIGHGEPDGDAFSHRREIFGVEGAVPVFRRQALESIRVLGEIADHDLFWYGEDLDVAWRIHLAGWKQIYEPGVIAWHDRGTTKAHTHGGWLSYIKRVNVRRQLPIRKRRLEWRNTRWTRIKNDYILNILKDLPYILLREIEVLGYAILFEPGVLKEIPTFLQLLPRMLRKRRAIMAKAVAGPSAIHKFFT